MQPFFRNLFFFAIFVLAIASHAQNGSKENPTTGAAAYADWSQQKPGTFRKITVADLPQPHATTSVDNGPEMVARPTGAMPQVPPGSKLKSMRMAWIIRVKFALRQTVDIFLVESHKGEIKVFRGIKRTAKPCRQKFLPPD